MNCSNTLINVMMQTSFTEGITFISRNEEHHVDYSLLRQRSLSILYMLQRKGFEPGQKVIIQTEDNQRFIECFWACLLGGFIAVPVSAGQGEDQRLKMAKIWNTLESPVIITSNQNLLSLLDYAKSNEFSSLYETWKRYSVTTEELDWTSGDEGIPCNARETDMAFIQFSSGSTGNPKGVVLTHRNILTNMRAIVHNSGATSNDSSISWMPLTHDMGLIGFHLTPLLAGMKQYIMSTSLFIMNPMLWLAKTHEHRITTLASPNFGYHHLLRHFDEALAETLDLSCVRLIFNGAEPISAQLCREFSKKMKEYGLNQNAMFPVYGMAEATLAVTFPPVHEPLQSIALERNSLHSSGEMREAVANEAADAIEFVDVGFPVADCEVRIIGEDGRKLIERAIGSIQIRGPHVTSGYYNNIQATQSTIDADGWLDTGDLGFLRNERLIITGRKKDLIIINGQNVYPHDLERIAAEECAVELGKVAACGVFNLEKQTDEIAFFVTYRGKWQNVVPLIRELKKKMNVRMGMEISYVIPVRTIPKTTSGKVQRYLLVQQFTAGEFDKSIAQIEEALDKQQIAEAGVADVEPMSPYSEIEKRMIPIWEDALKVRVNSRESHFFESGGHSMKAATLLANIYIEFQTEVSLSDFFLNPTFAGLAFLIEQSAGRSSGVIPQIRPIREGKHFPLTGGQRNVYLEEQQEGVGVSYNVPVVFLIEGDVDAKKLEQALQKLVLRHEALRTSIDWKAGDMIQTVQANIPVRMEIEESAETIASIVRRFVRPFQLNSVPLFRAGLVRCHDNRQYLLFDAHHAIVDGISIRILLEQWLALYGGQPLQQQPLQLKDAAVWMAGTGVAQAEEHSKMFWRNQLAAELPGLRMPMDRSRPEKRTFCGDTVQFQLPADLAAAIDQFARSNKMTVNAVLFAVYFLLLHRYTGQNDLVSGTLTSGRTRSEMATIVGMFNHFLPVRMAVCTDESFRKFAGRVHQHLTDLYAHQDYPLERIVADTAMHRTSAHSRLFDTMLIVHNEFDADIAIEISGLRLIQNEVHTGTAKLDFKLDVYMNCHGLLRGVWEFNTNLFEKSSMERMSNHYTELLRSTIAAPDQMLSTFEMTSERERQLLVDWNATEAEYPAGVMLHELFERQTERDPSRPAVYCSDRHITYGELNARANRLALWLREIGGIKADTIVALMAERSIDLVVAIMAVLKAGGAYLPIDPHVPQERIRYMLEDSGAGLLLTQRRFADLANQLVYAGKTVCLDDELLYVGDGGNLEPIASSHHLAYVIYTSGSTGRPKGVMIEHEAAVNRLHWMQRRYPLTVKDRILQKTPYTFDVSVWELLWWTIAGAAVVMLGPREEKDPAAIAEAVERYGVTTMHFVPSMLRLFLDEAENRPCQVDRLTSLKRVFASGEALPSREVGRFNQVIADHICVRLINLYGPTEAAIDVTSFDCPWSGELDSVPIGKPIDNIRMYVVGPGDRLQPIGLPGELCIAGIGLARGYLNRLDLTAEKFVPCPFEPEGNRMYRTGDLARWREDGQLEYLGRLDHQVKIRGYRIELGEIEAALMSHDGIREAVVMGKGSSGNEYLLYAYFAATSDVSIAEIRSHLAVTLPEYMIPSFYVQVDNIPINSSGKADRKALAQLEVRLDDITEYVAPQNEWEAKLAVIWQDVLGLEQVGRHDHFFEIGGHSLKAMQLLHRLHKEMQVELSLRHIFSNPTIEKLAAILSVAQKSVHAPITAAEVRKSYPLSAAQNRLYVLHRFEGIGTAYHLPAAFVCEGLLDEIRLERAIQTLIGRHESLRTSFELVDGMPMQIIHPQVPFQLERLVGNEASLFDVIKTFTQTFNLGQAPLLRTGIMKLTGEQFLILFDIHHMISDGVSMSVLVQEFADLYEGKELPALKVQYKDFTMWQQSFLASELLLEQQKYWLETFADEVPLLNMSTDFKRPALKRYEGARVAFTFSAAETERFKSLAAESDATLFMVLLAVFTIFLSRYSGQDDIVVGSPVSGRPHADLHNLIGMFVNTLPLRNYPSAEKTFSYFLQELSENTVKALENQDYPFEELMSKLQLPRDISRNPLFEALLVLQNMEIPELTIDQCAMKPLAFEHSTSKFDLVLELTETGDGLNGHLEYSTQLFREETVRRFVGHIRSIALAVAENPQIQLGAIEMLTNEERGALHQFNDTACAYPQHLTIQQIFEEQAAKTPDRSAVVCEAERLTYAELNNKANRVAERLRSKGVVPNERVAILTERSIDMIVGMLAILKAGGCYVPIDPAYPADRIQYMLSDCEARFVLTHSPDTNILGDSLAAEWIDISEFSVQQCENLSCVNNPGDLAYIIYTSGTTGKPKGVMIEHRNVVRLLIHDKPLFDFTKDDVWTMFHSYCFDFSVWEMYGALLFGGKLVVVPKQTAQNPQRFLQLLVEENVTVLNQTPSAFYNLIHFDMEKGAADLRLKVVIFGGEALKPAMLKTFHGKYPDTRLVNMYGITETTVHVTYKEITDREIQENVSNIGRPIPTLSCYIMDTNFMLSPVGVPGELYVGGEGVARGYLNRAELTADKFVSNPFLPRTRLYRSGDLARWLPDGTLEYMGRLDHQVKLRGFRIELGEIEAVLLRHERIADAVVLINTTQAGDERLCAYFVASGELSVAEIRAFLSRTLPDYMIPSSFTTVERIPLTTNGKVDRKVLTGLTANLEAITAYSAPKNEMEAGIVTIWRELLQLERISRQDHFFEIGGNSLLLIRMHAMLEEQFPGVFKVTDLFSRPTVAGLAELLAEREGKDDAVALKGILMPADYFKSRDELQPPFSYRIVLDRRVCQAIDQWMAIRGISPETFFASAWFLLFQHATGGASNLVLHVRDASPHSGKQIVAEPSRLSGFDALFHETNHDLGRDHEDVYPLAHAKKFGDSDKGNQLFVLLDFYKGGGVGLEIASAYDAVVHGFKENGQYGIVWESCGNRLKRDKAKMLAGRYAAICKWMTEEYGELQASATKEN